MKRNLIGFSGPMCSGKTSAAKILGVTPLSFATPLKKCVQELFKFSDEQLYTFEGKQAVDPRYGVSPRIVMQKFGTEFVREVVPDLWLILMKQNFLEIPEKTLTVVDDCRFENELQLIRDEGGVIVHILGRNPMGSSHQSEKPLRIAEGDYRVYNTEDIAAFTANVNTLVGKILNERGYC